MKSNKNIYSIVMYAILVMFASVSTSYAQSSSEETTAKEVKKEMADLLDTLKSYTVEQRDKAVEKTQKAMDKLDKRIDTLESRIDKNWDTMTKKARKETRANMKDLREQRIKMAEWYGRMTNSSASAWGDVKKGFSNAYKTLEKAWDNSEHQSDSDK